MMQPHGVKHATVTMLRNHTSVRDLTLVQGTIAVTHYGPRPALAALRFYY